MLRTPLTRLLTAFVAFSLVLAASAPALAQDATPAASPVAGGAGPQVGDAVVLFSSSGREEAQVAVTQLVDPFEEAESNPRRGFHHVMAEVVVENLSDAPYEFNPYQLNLVDAEGFTYPPTFGFRPSDAVTALPDFQPGTLEPGQSASGALVFEVIDGASISLVTYADNFDRFTVLVDQRASVPAEGEPVPVYDDQGDEVGSVSVDQIVTGLEETDSGVRVDRGQTAVAVVLTASATGAGALVSPANPANGVQIIDEFGVAYFPIVAVRSEESIAQLPDFPAEDIAGGSTATGAVIFALPADAIVTYVLYSPEFTKLTIVGQPGEGSVISGDRLEPVAVPTEEPADEEPTEEPIEVPTAEPTEDEPPAALPEDCADLQDWVDATGENLATVDQISIFNTNEFDAADLREDAAALRDVAAAQREIDTPAIAEEAQESVVAFLEAYADLLDEGADSLEDGVASDDIFQTAFTEGPFAEAASDYARVAAGLENACPTVDFGPVATTTRS